ncbi:MAG: hypothetical protein K940chlam7_01588, partial [Chlamydiae bacterium]|nr:hypothetical protein [Chlamydiota bacterium]
LPQAFSNQMLFILAQKACFIQKGTFGNCSGWGHFVIARTEKVDEDRGLRGKNAEKQRRREKRELFSFFSASLLLCVLPL